VRQESDSPQSDSGTGINIGTTGSYCGLIAGRVMVMVMRAQGRMMGRAIEDDLSMGRNQSIRAAAARSESSVCSA
jgi:hypothetical protein